MNDKKFIQIIVYSLGGNVVLNNYFDKSDNMEKLLSILESIVAKNNTCKCCFDLVSCDSDPKIIHQCTNYLCNTPDLRTFKNIFGNNDCATMNVVRLNNYMLNDDNELDISLTPFCDKLKNNENIILKSIVKNYNILYYISNDLKNNSIFVDKCLKIHPNAHLWFH